MANRFEEFSDRRYWSYLDGLSDAELAQEIKDFDFWDTGLLRELCWRADLIDEWEEADDNYMDIAYKAAEKLGVEID